MQVREGRLHVGRLAESDGTVNFGEGGTRTGKGTLETLDDLNEVVGPNQDESQPLPFIRKQVLR
jgi:hypothetical protein